jgi:GNAT superfamily N-acetyltransferase
MSVDVRDAGPPDAAVIASIHALSWKDAYRGILSDDYLANDVDAERLAMWTGRMAAWNPRRHFARIASVGGIPAGFACVLTDEEPEHGALLDNLHILPAHRASGLGRRLLADAGRWVARTFPGTPMHLTVFQVNERARAFYRRMGGAESEPFDGFERDGRYHRVVRVSWAEPGAIA